jgi:putative ABC transport system permease protein
VAGDAGLAIEARDTHDDLATLRTTATAAGVALALAIIAMTIGLLRGESAGDLRTLTATGAGPRTRRSLSATTAGVLAALGVVLGAGGAYAALVAAYHAQLWRLASPPVLELVVIGLGVPVLAATTGWALAGRDPETFSRQLLD